MQNSNHLQNVIEEVAEIDEMFPFFFFLSKCGPSVIGHPTKETTNLDGVTKLHPVVSRRSLQPVEAES